MERNAVTDELTKQPKLQADGLTPRTQIYIALAIPKIVGVDWKATEWGLKIVQAGKACFVNGESDALTFAWKVTDGDSTIPNQRGKKPCEQEGFAGNWVIKATTELSVRCHHAGKYEAHDVIQNPKEIKRGDYGRLYISVKGNAPAKSAGVYINPELFSLDRAGEEILIVGGTDAKTAFGDAPAGGAPATPPATPPAPPATPPAPPAIPPAPDFLTPKPQRLVNGQAFTEEALIAQGWSLEMIQPLPVA
jgi:hypothetical protein